MSNMSPDENEPAVVDLKQRISKLSIKGKRVVCPICGMEGAYAVFKRHTRSNYCKKAVLAKRIVDLKLQLQQATEEYAALAAKG
jgi:hypothetical protein